MSATKTRRAFLAEGAAILAGLPAWMPRLAFAPNNSAPRGDVLVCLFLRGAADALNMVVPHGEDEYYRLRPSIAIPRPDHSAASSAARTVDLDGFFGLHPALRGLLPLWDAGHLALVHACGAPDESRSHFRSMELMERGVAADSGPATGWIGRHLASLDPGNHSPLRAIGLGASVPHMLRGPIPATALRSIADFHLGGDAQAAATMQAALNRLYSGDTDTDGRAIATLDLLSLLEKLNSTSRNGSGAANYPQSDFGLAMRQVALLIRADVGLEVACIDLGGWDTHFAQGGSEGQMAGLLADLGAGIAAFYADLQDHLDHLLVLTLSEFGRRLEENGSLGTDHGHGSMMMLLGGAVSGGKVHGQWPGLGPDQLIGPGDLAATTDYRDILAEVVAGRLHNKGLGTVFPNYNPQFRGVLRKVLST